MPESAISEVFKNDKSLKARKSKLTKD